MGMSDDCPPKAVDCPDFPSNWGGLLRQYLKLRQTDYKFLQTGLTSQTFSQTRLDWSTNFFNLAKLTRHSLTLGLTSQKFPWIWPEWPNISWKATLANHLLNLGWIFPAMLYSSYSEFALYIVKVNCPVCSASHVDSADYKMTFITPTLQHSNSVHYI